MTDTEKLRRIIDLSGLKINYIAKVMGISRTALAQKISNQREFKASEIVMLCKLLGITGAKEKEAIFFSEKVA